MTHNKLTCLFGHHDYRKKLTKDNRGVRIHLCKICKRSGYTQWSTGSRVYYDFDGEGNLVYEKCGNGTEYWYSYDNKGNLVYLKWSGGGERWKIGNSLWVTEKPKNWKYEKCITS